MKITDVIVDPELESFLPPITDDELAALRESVQQDGWTDPIIVWLNHSTLVDGHNRYKLWQEQGSDPEDCPEIMEKKFADKAAVMEWMFRRQNGRRNMTPAQRAAVALKMKPAIEERAKANEVSGGKAAGSGRKKGLTNSSNPISAVHTRKEIAKVAGVSEDTVRKTETVIKEGSPEVVRALESGEITANAAFKETRRSQFDPETFDPAMKPGKPPKNGSVVKPKYDEKKIDKPLGQIRRELDERLKVFPGTDRLFRAAKFALNQFWDTVEAWRKSK